MLQSSQRLRAVQSLLVVSCSSFAAAVPPPLEIPFNTSGVMGPDGPWNFITLNVGSNPASNVSFFPVVENPFSILVGSENCQRNSTLCQSNAEFYDTSAVSAMSNPQNLNKTILSVDNASFYGRVANFANLKASWYYWLETLNEPINYNNISTVISDNWTEYSGTQAYVPLSLLSVEQLNYLNPPVLNLTSGGVANTTTVMQESARDGLAASFGLHMGAAMFNQPGSLYFGGYDINRAVEPIHRVETDVGFQIVNVSFGVASGRSPWDNGTSLPSSFATPPLMDPGISMLPQAPYLYLPQPWCDAMALYLPVSYDSNTNLYIWNRTDPRFNDIVTSPSYINFTFQQNSSFSIRAPFATLNLTLDPPIVEKPTQYFPCYGNSADIGLGRAFLQSAIWGRAWPDAAGVYFLGQAPGPSVVNKSTVASPVSVDQTNPVYSARAGGPSWEESWQGVLTPMPLGSSSQKLSGGAIAGIVIGVLVGVGLIAAAGAWWFFKLRRRRRSGGDSGSTVPGSGPIDGYAKTGQQQMAQATSSELAAAGSSPARQELSINSNTATAAAVSQPLTGKIPQLDSRERRFEMNGRIASELDGSHVRDVTGDNIPETGPPLRHELPAHEQQ